jgi:hypothetical protein
MLTRFFTHPTTIAAQLSRRIHNPVFIPDHVSRILIAGNNSIFFAALQAMELHGAHNYPKITLLATDFWLDKVDMQEYGQLHWGQTALSFPFYVRRMFQDYRPHYPMNKFVTWADYQQLRLIALEKLNQNPNIELLYGNPQSVNKTQEGYHLSTEQQTIALPDSTYFYLWYRIPRLPASVTQAHTLLYETPRAEIPKKIIVIGHGLSIVWLLKHFPELTIVNIKLKNDRLPTIPSNASVDLEKEIRSGRLVIHETSKVELLMDADMKNGAILSRNTDMILHEGPVYGATGLEPEYHKFNAINPKQKLSMPIFDRDQNLIGPRDEEMVRLIDDTFLAPKNVALGSMPHSFMSLMELTKNISWTAEPMLYFKESAYYRLSQIAENKGLILDMSFFNALDTIITELDDANNHDASLAIYRKVYQETYKATQLELTIFDTVLDEYFARQVHDEVTTNRVHEQELSTLRSN